MFTFRINTEKYPLPLIVKLQYLMSRSILIDTSQQRHQRMTTSLCLESSLHNLSLFFQFSKKIESSLNDMKSHVFYFLTLKQFPSLMLM